MNRYTASEQINFPLHEAEEGEEKKIVEKSKFRLSSQEQADNWATVVQYHTLCNLADVEADLKSTKRKKLLPAHAIRSEHYKLVLEEER